MNIKEIEKTVSRIQSHIFKNSNSFSVGMLKSHFRGAGIQFKEHQVYNPGDDVRFIDWKLSAKTTNTFVKTFEEERNVEIVAFLDITESMLLGFKGITKLQASLEIICLLYLLAEKTGDMVRVIVACDELKVLMPTSGHKGISMLVSFLEKSDVLTPKGQVNLEYRSNKSIEASAKLGLIKSYVARNKEVVLLSDFSSFKGFTDVIGKISTRKNVQCVRIVSPVDVASKNPFSFYAKKLKGKHFVSANSKGQNKVDLIRYSEISVKERYLENFIHELL